MGLRAAVDYEIHAQILLRIVKIVACIWVLERLWPAGGQPTPIGRVRNTTFYVINTLTMLHLPLVASWVFPSLPNVELLSNVLPGRLRTGLGGGVAMTLCYALVWDFFQYWFHRLAHRSPLLWSIHVVHHRDPALNTTSSLRTGFGELVAGFYFVHIPTFLICGGGMVPYYGSLVLFSGWGFVNHANVRLRLGPLAAWLSGPQTHRMHHGLAREYRNCNFAAFFTFYDRMFGTFRRPARGEWPATGVREARSPRNILSESFVPQLRHRQSSRGGYAEPFPVRAAAQRQCEKALPRFFRSTRRRTPSTAPP